jgi:hypothetical protein
MLMYMLASIRRGVRVSSFSMHSYKHDLTNAALGSATSREQESYVAVLERRSIAVK